jgi:hypothetical protein
LQYIRTGSAEEVEKMARDWLNLLTADFYDTGIQKIIAKYNKCLNLHGNEHYSRGH